MSLDEALPASLESVLDSLREFLEACLEVDAVRALTEALSAKQYEILGHPFSLTVEGRIASAVHARDPSGRELWALVEVKPRLRAADIRPGHGRCGSQATARTSSSQASRPQCSPTRSGSSSTLTPRKQRASTASGC